ncbi:MAG: Protein-L-isoaspartate(D-aspartate)O-methyltrans ferase [Parcubacteria group bacterium GW2011_GWA2_47_10]|nr:MAG: Protein-L-isoaspartate(D-aspartate)O-methyltrans ferase [Parcubacteria group bacterium GW2011_GWA2_47_10]OGZ98985.1 MAG: hypothetical protein A3D57_01425 [Candidatus Sungbacteria bacterium RIFCSPHIGHO2_02_FULL_46_12]
MHTKESLVEELTQTGVLKTPTIIEAFRTIDRIDFVPLSEKGVAYENRPLPIGFGQTISQPYTVAFMLELLQPKPGQKILDVGSGSGWQTALLSNIVSGGSEKPGRVIATERIPTLSESGKINAEKYGFVSRGVAVFYCRDAGFGVPEESPFDAIIAAASSGKEIPDEWKRELKPGGKILAPVGNSLKLFSKISDSKWVEQEFPGFVFVPFVRDEKGDVAFPKKIL